MKISISYDWVGATKRVKAGEVKIEKKSRRIGYLNFVVDETQIFISDLSVNRYYRKKGYGRLLIMMVMALSEELKKPILLFSTDESENFYRKVGMRKLFAYKEWENVKVEFMNLNPKKKFCEQCSDLDYVWVPSGLRTIQIYL